MNDELREDYQFDYSKAKPNRFAAKLVLGLTGRSEPAMSLTDPSGAELVNDGHFAQLIEHVCRHPGMHVTPETLETVLAFLDGYNRGQSGGLLAGLRE